MKIYMRKTYEVYEAYGPIEINVEEHPELEGKTEEEVIQYLNETMYDENIIGGDESTLADEFTFNTEMIKQKYSNEQEEIVTY
jgi:hypothetical protein